MTELWHASDELLMRFAVDPAAMDGSAAASLEAHLISCDRCRSSLNDVIDADQVSTSWLSIAERIDEPRLSALERVLGRLGVSEATARLIGATHALVAAALSAVVVVAAAVVAASRVTDTSGGFLVVAPLLPLAVVAACFAPASDPAGEAGIATPLYGIGLVLRRSGVVLVAVFIVLGVADQAIGDLGAPVLTWLLPSLALAVGTLALGTWFRAEVAAGGLGFGWVVVVVVARWMEGRTEGYAESAVFGAAGQLVALIVLVVAVVGVVNRRDRFQTMEASR